jgi:hypothetical protein
VVENGCTSCTQHRRSRSESVNLNFFDSAQCLMVRRWRLIGYFPILYKPTPPLHGCAHALAPLPSWLTQVGSLVQAATNFKLAKLWDEAGGAFLKLAECHEQVRAL